MTVSQDEVAKNSPFFLRQLSWSRSSFNITPQTVLVSPTTNYSQHRQSVSVFWNFARSIHTFGHQVFAEKSNLDRESLSSYRPISNLPFISKTIERLVNTQPTEHLDTNTVVNSHQSAFMKHHSIETVIFPIHDHLVQAVSHQSIAGLCLSDLYAAFDQSFYSWASLALPWIPSYCSCVDCILSSLAYLFSLD